MDIGDTCLLEKILTISCSTDDDTTENNSSSSNSSEGTEIERSDKLSGSCHLIEPLHESFTNGKPENSARRLIEENKNHLFSDSDNSFEVFLPQKHSNLKSVPNSKNTGKFKTKKNTKKSRSCPYFTAKTVPSYFKPISKSQEEKDLEIAIARSLLDISGSNENTVKYSEVTTCEGTDDKPVVNAFQIKSVTKESTVKLKNWTGNDSKKNNKTLLQRRTFEDRERIITQKLAIVLIDEGSESSDQFFPKDEIVFSSSVLGGFFDKKSRLWELSKLTVDGYIPDFYVSSLKDFIEQPSSFDFYKDSLDALKVTEFKMSSSSGSVELLGPVEEPDENDILVIDVEDEDEDINVEKKDDSLDEQNLTIKNGNDTAEESEDTFPHVTSNLECIKELSNDWASLFGDSKFSDCGIRIGEEVIPTHKIVFYVRCRPLLNDFDNGTWPCVMDFSIYCEKSVKAFLKFLYSGNIEPSLYLTSIEKGHFRSLFKKYKIPYLENILQPTSFDAIYSQSTWSIESKDGSQKKGDPRTIANVSKSKSNISPGSLSNSVEPFIVSDNSSEPSRNDKVGKTPENSSRHFDLFSRSSPNVFVYQSPIDTIFTPQAKQKFLDKSSSKKKRKSASPSSAEKLVKSKSKIASHAKKVRKRKSECDSTPANNGVKSTSVFLPPTEKILNNSSVIFVESSSDGSCSDLPLTQPQTTDSIDLDSTKYENPHGFDETFRNIFGYHIDVGEYNKSRELISYGGYAPEPSAGGKNTNETKLTVSSSNLIESSKNSPLSTCFPTTISEGQPPADKPPVHLPAETMKVVEDEEQLRKKSSLGAYFQSSFPNSALLDEVEMQLRTFQACTPISSPTQVPPAQNINTPKADMSLIIKDATPRSDYATMVSPQLREELKRFGLKQSLSRNKAVTLLGYIYDQLHPEVPEEPQPSTSKALDTDDAFDSL